MIAACGPLQTRELAAGINRVTPFRLRAARVRKELRSSDLVVCDRSGDTWHLSPTTDPAVHGWPTDRALLELARGTGRRTFGAAEIADLLDRAGYQGLGVSGYLRDAHPLIRTAGTPVTRRWTVWNR
jgi:hypothetical protein